MELRNFPGGSDCKEFACNAGDPGLIPASGRPPGEGNGNPLQFLPGESHGQTMGSQRVRHDWATNTDFANTTVFVLKMEGFSILFLSLLYTHVHTHSLTHTEVGNNITAILLLKERHPH